MSAGVILVAFHYALMGVLLLVLCVRIQKTPIRIGVAVVGAAGFVVGATVLIGVPLGIVH